MTPVQWIVVIVITIFLGIPMLTFAFSFLPAFFSGARFSLECSWAISSKNFYINLPVMYKMVPLFAPFNADIHTVCEAEIVDDYTNLGANTEGLASKFLDLTSSCWGLLSINDFLIDEGNTLRCFAGELQADLIYPNGVLGVAPGPNNCENYGLCEQCITECDGEGYCFASVPSDCDGARLVTWIDSGTTCNTDGTCYCVDEENTMACEQTSMKICLVDSCLDLYGCNSGEWYDSVADSVPPATTCTHCSDLCSKYGLSNQGYCIGTMPSDSCKDETTLYDWTALPEGVGDNCGNFHECYCVNEDSSVMCGTGYDFCDPVLYTQSDIGLVPDIEVQFTNLSFYPKIVFIKPGPNGAEYVDMKENAQPISADYFEVVFSDWSTWSPEGTVTLLNIPGTIGGVASEFVPETKMRYETIFSYLTPDTRLEIAGQAGQGCNNNLVDSYTQVQSWESWLPVLGIAPSSSVDGPVLMGSSYPYTTRGCGPLKKSMVCCEDKIFVCLTDNLEMGYSGISECGDGSCVGGEDPCSCPQDCGPPSGTCI
jgi:hypothetical protein